MIMELCSSGHDEVCHDERECPCCKEIELRESWEEDYLKLEAEKKEVDNKVEELEDKISDLESVDKDEVVEEEER